jgi:hypothetical protein
MDIFMIKIMHYTELKIVTESVAIFNWLLAVRVLLRATPAATQGNRFKVISERPLIHTLKC